MMLEITDEKQKIKSDPVEKEKDLGGTDDRDKRQSSAYAFAAIGG